VPSPPSAPSPPSSPSTFAIGPDRVPGPRDLAALQRDTLAVIARAPAIFVLLPAVLFLPFDFANEWVSNAVGGDDVDGALRSLRVYRRIGQWIELGVGSFVVATVLSATVAVGEGRIPTLREALASGRDAWGRALKTTFVTGLVVGLATLLFVVPGLFLATRSMLAVPAAVIDGADSAAARARSSELVKGRGTFRLFLWATAALLSWSLLSLLPAFCVALVLPDATPPVLESALLALCSAAWNVVGAGLVVAAGLLYLELTERRLLWPVGLELRSSDGCQRQGPTGTGQTGLVVVGVLAGLAALVLVPLLAFAVWYLVSPEAVTDFMGRSALFNALFEMLGDEPR
jgi:hypothetical protein